MKVLLKNNYVNAAILALTLFTASCSKSDSDSGGDVSSTKFSPTATLVVKNAEERMPVWVNGNKDSKFIILAVHGGPGSDVLDFVNYQNGTAFKKIQEKYLVAYWQQRASGQSVGPDNKKYFTIAQYVDDADKVVDQLQKNYPDKKIVLFGHSWGGMLTSSYLKEASRRDKITAWIDAAGLHNGTTMNETSLADINTEADARITNGTDTDYWKGIKKSLSQNPSTININQTAYAVTNEIPEVLIKVNFDFKLSGRQANANINLFQEIGKTNNNQYLSNITMPCLVLWGKYDFVVSKTYQNELLQNIGSKNVTSIDFNASGHYMMFHEPDLFAKSVIDFVGTL